VEGLIKNNFGSCNYEFIDDYVHIYNLFVLPEFRRQGKAREILQSAIDAIRKTRYEGKIKIVANSKEKSIDIEKLISFYKLMGLEVFTHYM
jgi:ribosomal protein S18 acetylase RimI-like enzyme